MTVLRNALIPLVGVIFMTLVSPGVSHTQTARVISIPANAVRHPWTGNCSIIPASNGNYASCVIRVPANEEVVIQTVTGDLSLIGPTHVITQVSPTIGGVTSYWLSMEAPVNVNGTDYYKWSSPTTLYADPGTSIVILLTDPSAKIRTLGGVGITLVGYYVSQSSPSKSN